MYHGQRAIMLEWEWIHLLDAENATGFGTVHLAGESTLVEIRECAAALLNRVLLPCSNANLASCRCNGDSQPCGDD